MTRTGKHDFAPHSQFEKDAEHVDNVGNICEAHMAVDGLDGNSAGPTRAHRVTSRRPRPIDFGMLATAWKIG